MPNWCEGFLKVRGKISNLKAFVLNGLQPVTIMGEDAAKLAFTSEDETSFSIWEIKDSLWLKGTRRHFCEPDYIEVYGEDTETPAILIMPMKAAWGINSEFLLALCKEYEVDMKVQGFERGMQFSQIIEIIDGSIIQDRGIKYENWDWDCPCPLMGG